MDTKLKKYTDCSEEGHVTRGRELDRMAQTGETDKGEKR